MARILLMDDEDALRTAMAEILTAEGHDVVESATGTIASDTDVLDRIDLVITDIIMPDVEGMEVVRRVMGYRPALPILAISGGGRTVTSDFLPVMVHMGARDTLKKPFAPDELVSRVEALLAGGATNGTA